MDLEELNVATIIPKEDGNEVSDEEKLSGHNESETNPIEPIKKQKPIVLTALLWKNFTLKRKRRVGSCCEILIPTLFILLLLFLKGLTQIEEIPQGWTEDFVGFCPYTDRSATSPLVQVPCVVPFNSFVFDTDVFPRFFLTFLGADPQKRFGRLCVAHSGNEREEVALGEFIDYIENEGTVQSGVFEQIRSAIFTTGSGTGKDIQNYMDSGTYGQPFSEDSPQCVAVLIFDKIDFDKAQFKYTIRGNNTIGNDYFDVHETSGDLVEFERDIDTDEFRDYIGDGYANLQQLVDSFFISKALGKYKQFPINVDTNDRRVIKERGVFEPSNILAGVMPISGFTRDIFFTLVQELLPLIFVVVYLMPVSQIIAVIVLEKEVRAREMMRLMGVSDFKIISSWYITYIIFFAILAGIITLGGNLLFPATTSAAGGFSLAIFFLFFSFSLSIISFSFVISTLFSKAFNGVVFGLMLYIILFFMFYVFSDNFVVPNGPLFIPQVAFSFGLKTLAIFEETGVGVTSDLVSVEILGFSIMRAILWLLLDTSLLTILGFYLNAVIPGEFGATYPWYFPVLPKYWKKAFSRTQVDQDFVNAADYSELRVLNGEKIEEPNETLKGQVGDAVGVQIRGMTKVFGTPDGPKVAVNDLSLDVFEGQILVLLGHNGAGKTTSLQMLSGSLGMTSGEAYIYGSRVRTDLDTIRKSLGFCPQHDVLYKELSVNDHLTFYGKVKGIKGEELNKQIDASLEQVGLTEKKYVKSKNLSGGMKRKLSLAISLIGDSKVIFVDEPTSGVDTFSRRSMWEILQNAREGRVIILTTHFMDEADLLGDRIAIMAEGELQCVGSSFFLKQLYGAGYRLIFTKKEGCDSSVVEDLVLKHVPTATKSADVGTELSFQLPLDKSDTFAPLFTEVDDLMETEELQVTSYGISVTTMEEVFLKAGQSEDLVEGAKEFGEEDLSDDDNDKKDENYTRAETALFDDFFFFVFFRQFMALFIKRVNFARRDKYAFMCNTLVPATIFAIGLMVLTFSGAFENEPPLEMTVNQLNPDFPLNKRGFLPIVELSTVDKLPFEGGRIAQQGNFPQFNLERPFINRTEPFADARVVFEQEYLNGFPTDCRNQFRCPDIINQVGDAVLDIGEALLFPDEQFKEQVEDRNGASVFGSIVFHQQSTTLDEGGCLFVDIGVDLNEGITVSSNQVQCSVSGSPCVMFEVEIDIFGNDIFACLPAGCLSDLAADDLNDLFSIVSGGLTGEDDQDTLTDLIANDNIFFCEDELCNSAPASINDFSICRGGPAFDDDICVVDKFFRLDTDIVLNDEETEIVSITFAVDEEANYCSERDFTDVSINEFLDESVIPNGQELAFQFDDPQATTCLKADNINELQLVVSIQQSFVNANIEGSFNVEEQTCVDQEFECSASIFPLTAETTICIVDTCISNAEKQDITDQLLGDNALASQAFNFIFSGLDSIPCAEVIQTCNTTLDFKEAIQTVDVLISENIIFEVLESDIVDTIIEIFSNLTDTFVASGITDSRKLTRRNLQPNESETVCENEDDCFVLGVQGVCLQVNCVEELGFLGIPEDTDLIGFLDLFNQTFDINVPFGSCGDLAVIDELACLNDTIIQVADFGHIVKSIIDIFVNLTESINVSKVIDNKEISIRNLQSNDIVCENEDECFVLGVQGVCLQVNCLEELDFLGIPEDVDLNGFLDLFNQTFNFSLPFAACAEPTEIDELACLNDTIIQVADLSIDNIFNPFTTFTTLEDLFITLSELGEIQANILAGIINTALNTNFDGEGLVEVFELLTFSLDIVELIILQPDLVTQLLTAVLNNGNVLQETCAELDSCVLVESDLNFGLICLPGGCASSFFDDSDNSTKTTAEVLDSSFQGFTSHFLCSNDNCNEGCQLPSNCESSLLSPVVFNEENDGFEANELVCSTLRYSYFMIANTTSINIVPILMAEAHTSLLRRSLIEYFDFTSPELADASFEFIDNEELISRFEGGVFGNSSVKFKFPNEEDAPRITVVNHPMPFVQSTQEIFDAIIAFTTAIFCVLAFAFIPGPMISYVVMEKEEAVQIKHLQFVSGVGVFAYWLSNYVFDLFSFMVPFVLSLLLINIFSVTSFIENGAFSVVIVVFFGYGLAIIPFSYLIGHLFKKHTSALIWIIVINCITGVVLMIASFAMDQIPETQDLNGQLKLFYRISPGFCLGDSLLNIAITSLIVGLIGEEDAPSFYDDDVAGLNIKYLYTTAILFFLIVVLIEFTNLFPSFKRLFSKIPEDEDIDYEIDEDVLAEAKRVEESTAYQSKSVTILDEVEAGAKRDVLTMINLRKVYGNGKVAVKGVSLGIPEGECLGYLGINGAGKTTTMKCLTGDIQPTAGTGYINGYNIVSQQWKVRQHIGYCSQFSSILGLLTVREHFQLFCRIKQIVNIEYTVQKLLKRLSLTPFENKLAKSLSGGNKRKLSVGIAMIGSPAVMLLDEPSTGMDVASRRFMWNVIENMVAGKYDGKKTSVVLTTHSMEECEALCSRVGIMVGGRLRCLGSIQHLKSRFGTGYTIEVKFQFISKAEILAFIEQYDLNNEESLTEQTVKEILDKFDNKIGLEKFENGTGSSWNIRRKLESNSLKASVLVEWAKQQESIDAIEKFLEDSFQEVESVEAHDYKLTYRVAKNDQTRLSNLFEAMEDNKEVLNISEYAVSQTTLEQIFNGFAAQQEEEQRIPQNVSRITP